MTHSLMNLFYGHLWWQGQENYSDNIKMTNINQFKGPLSRSRQFLTIENPLKTMKNAFYIM